MKARVCKVAVMDLGSQTFRVAGARVSNGRAEVLFSIRNNVRMGQSLLRDGRLSQDALKRGIGALKEFLKVLEKHEIGRFRAMATEAFRRAENAGDFIDRAREIGVGIEVIGPEEEAALAVKGAYLTLEDVKGQWIMVDSGGASTEMALCERDRFLFFKSMNIGAVTLTETCQEIWEGFRDCLRASARTKVEEGLSGVKARFHGVQTLVATGGTATTVAAVLQRLSSYDPKKVRGFEVAGPELDKLFNELLAMDVCQRMKVRGLEPERADIFPAGIAILLEVIRYLGLRKIVISDGGILLGLLAAFMEKECKFYAESSGARGLYL